MRVDAAAADPSPSRAASHSAAAAHSAFYFDLASPLAYLAAERILHTLPGPIEWQPVLARDLPGSRPSETFRGAEEGELQGADKAELRGAQEEAASREQIERRAGELGLQPLRWPDRFPFDSTLAMLAATYAKGIGRVVPFAQAAFRQAFAGGHDLERADFVAIAAAACEMHPQAILRGAELRSVRAQLASATGAAAAAGVERVPAVHIDGRLFAGERAIDDATLHLAGRASAR